MNIVIKYLFYAVIENIALLINSSNSTGNIIATARPYCRKEIIATD